jgi:hypothetical protein
MDAGAAAPPSSGADASGGGVTNGPAPDSLTDTSDLPIAPVYAMGRYSRKYCFNEDYKKCRR